MISNEDLGRGEFGVVYLVKTMIPDAPYYALKCINKNKISKMGMEKYLNVILFLIASKRKKYFDIWTIPLS
jgi:hypothetical protein